MLPLAQPKLKKGLTDFLKCKCTVPEMAAACKTYDALDLETRMQAAGLAATMCRTPAEWRASAQGLAMASLPPVVADTVKHVDSSAASPRLLPARCARPLSDVLVVDFSHVIASPVVGRTLADHGATVVKVISHDRPRREMFDCETNHGKRTLTIELATEDGRQRLWDLLKVADVVIDGFANAALARRGFSMAAVLEKNPHLVYLDVSCFGHVGPLSHGKGFQQNANFAAGVAGIADEELLGYQLVSQIDYATGDGLDPCVCSARFTPTPCPCHASVPCPRPAPPSPAFYSYTPLFSYTPPSVPRSICAPLHPRQHLARPAEHSPRGVLPTRAAQRATAHHTLCSLPTLSPQR